MVQINKYLSLPPMVVFCLMVLLNGCSSDTTNSSTNNESADQSQDYRFDHDLQGKAIVATVGKAAITRAEVDYQLAFYNSNSTSLSASDRQAVLDELVDAEVMAQQAMANGFDQSPQVKINVRKLIAHEYRKYIEQQAREQTRVTDAEAQLYYQQNIDSYTKPAMFRLALYQRRKDVERQHEKTLSQIASAARFIEPLQGFGEYAFSSDHNISRSRGGRLSWIHADTRISGIPDAVIKAGAALAVGEISDVLAFDNKEYLVRKIDLRPQQVTDFSQVKADIVQRLLKQNRQRLLSGFQQQAKSELNVTINQDVLQHASAKQQPAPTPPGFPVQ